MLNVSNDTSPSLGGSLNTANQVITNDSGGTSSPTVTFQDSAGSYHQVEMQNTHSNSSTGEVFKHQFFFSANDSSGIMRSYAGIYGAYGVANGSSNVSVGFHEFWAKDQGSNVAYMRGRQGSVSIQKGLYVGDRTVVGTDNEVRAEGEITAFYSSDARLKENVVTIDGALDKVMAMRGVSFDWKDEHIEKRGGEDGYFVRKEDIGFIAQELEPILPTVVRKRKDETLAVDYQKMVAVLVEAMKEQQEQIKALTEQVNSLITNSSEK